jgi:hypothetical protein
VREPFAERVPPLILRITTQGRMERSAALLSDGSHGCLMSRSASPRCGSALVCNGGCVLVGSAPALSPTTGLSIQCWGKTEQRGQANTWFVNRVLSGGTSTGHRMGLPDDKPCFEVPQTDFGHHLTADTRLPLGRWVHLAGTFDGQTMRIYVDGEDRGPMERPGPVWPNDFDLCLGNVELRHAAYFRGLLDEVKVYSRALTAEEVRGHYGRLAGKAR